MFELGNVTANFPMQIPGGQRQCAVLARVLIAKPSVLLLDEPFATLDPTLCTYMRSELFVL